MYAQVRGVRYRVNYRYGRAKIPCDLAARGAICAIIYTSPLRYSSPSTVRAEKVVMSAAPMINPQILENYSYGIFAYYTLRANSVGRLNVIVLHDILIFKLCYKYIYTMI